MAQIGWLALPHAFRTHHDGRLCEYHHDNNDRKPQQKHEAASACERGGHPRTLSAKHSCTEERREGRRKEKDQNSACEERSNRGRHRENPILYQYLESVLQFSHCVDRAVDHYLTPSGFTNRKPTGLEIRR